MHVIAKILAVAYLFLALFAAVLFAQVSVNYVNVTEIQLNVGDHGYVSRIELLWSGNATDPAEVRVTINVTNPGRISIELIGAELVLYMDDPYNPRPWYDPDKLLDTEIGPMSYTVGRGHGTVVPPGEERSVSATLTVQPGTEDMNRLDRPDADGRYHPIAMFPWFTFAFVDLDISSAPVYVAPYHEAEGVLPVG